MFSKPQYKKQSKHIFLHFPKHFYSKLYENSIVCYVGGAKVILISHIAAKQQSLVSFSRKREETDGEEYRRRISKRGGGREGGLCRCHRGAARGDPHCRCNLRAIVSQELLFNLEPFKKVGRRHTQMYASKGIVCLLNTRVSKAAAAFFSPRSRLL